MTYSTQIRIQRLTSQPAQERAQRIAQVGTRRRLNDWAVLALLLLGAPGCVTAEREDSEEESFAIAASAVELRHLGSAFVYDQTKPNASSTLVNAIDVTGALFEKVPGVQGPNGLIVRASCGATFISPTIAVTAGHCVLKTALGSSTLRLETYDISEMSSQSLAAGTTLTGTFPYERPNPFSSSSGYKVTRHTCKLISRCKDNEENAAANCPSELTGADMALVECPTRTGRWVEITPNDGVAASDGGTGVLMTWFHEVYQAPSGGSQDFAAHYVNLNEKKDNYHYLERDWSLNLSPLHQLVPLQTTGHRLGTLSELKSLTNNEVETDLFGCHGTSGSGVFVRTQANHLQLLGPVVHGGWWGTLCSPSDTPGTANLEYTSAQLVGALADRFVRISIYRGSRKLAAWGRMLVPNQTWVPLRATATLMGYGISWDSATSRAVLNNREYTAATIDNGGSAWVRATDFASFLGLKLEWDGTNRLVRFSNPSALTDGRYSIRSVNSGKCMEVASAATSDGALVDQATCGTSGHQLWNLVNMGGDIYEFRPAHTQKCLAVAEGSTENSAEYIQWGCTGRSNQRFVLEPYGATWLIRPTHASTRCVDVAWASQDDGAKVIQWPCHYGTNQQWQFTRQ